MKNEGESKPAGSSTAPDRAAADRETPRDTSPRVLVVGRDARAEALMSMLDPMKVEVALQHDPLVALAQFDLKTMAVVFIEPVAKTPTARAVRLYRRGFPTLRLPLFVLTLPETSSDSVMAMYQQGATAVFQWPDEEWAFFDMLVDTLGLHMRAPSGEKSDNTLVRAAVAAIEADGHPVGDAIQVLAHRGIVFLVGSIPTLWGKRRIEELLESLPGVRGVVTRDLDVTPKTVPDATIANAIRTFVKNTSELEEKTLDVSVSGGKVRLAGTVENRPEFLRLHRLVEHIRGVRDIETFVTLSNVQHEKDRSRAQKLARKLNDAFPDMDIEVAIFGSVAVLRGRSQRLSQKRRAGVAMLEHSDNAVERVVNKIEVTG